MLKGGNMKKVLSFILVVCILLTMVTMPAVAATTIKLSATEQSIAGAYLKSLETGDAKYLNKYKYPGVTFKMADYGSGVKAKVLNPKFSKVYDSKVKLYKLNVDGLLVTTDGESLAISKTPSQLYIKTYKNKVYAYKEPSIKYQPLSVENLTENETIALEQYLTSAYDEDTANALMYPSDGDNGEDTEDGNGDSPKTSIDTNGNSGSSAVSGTATLSAPVKLNSKYTWSETKKCLDDMVSGTFSLTVKGIKKITADDVADLGFKKPKADDKTEFALVDVKWEVKDAKIVSGTEDMYLNVGWDLDIWGVKTADGASIVGATDYGFDGSFDSNLRNVIGTKKISQGMTESYVAEGKVLMTLYKNKTNYLVVKNPMIEDYKSSFMYFILDGAGQTYDSGSAVDTENNTNYNPKGEDYSGIDTDSNSNVSSGTGAGIAASPVEMNQKYTWTVTDHQYAYDLISGTFSLTVKSSKKVTADDVVKLGFKKPESNDKADYYLTKVVWEVKDAKLKKGEKGLGYGYLSGGWDLSVWGFKTPEGDSYIGGCTDYGFDGSIGREMSKVDKKITPGMTGSCKVEGNILLTVPKGDTSYMVVKNESISDYKSSFIYFKVK
jgi:hypothetical protein